MIFTIYSLIKKFHQSNIYDAKNGKKINSFFT